MLQMSARVQKGTRMGSHQTTYLPAGTVRARYGVSDMSLWRWLRDEEMNFPKPIYINRYRYWRVADLLEWERTRPTSKAT
jgi:predicted DNA-binding transcriptional regulator AlpA